MIGEAKTKCFTVNGKQVCVTVDECTEAYCGYVPPASTKAHDTATSIKAKLRSFFTLKGTDKMKELSMTPLSFTFPKGNQPFAMITPSWAPMGPVQTMPQLQGPWAVARGQELPSVFTPMAKTVLTIASAALCAFHGTKRNGGSIFWGAVWFGLGAAFPVVTPIFAVAQGVGDCANNCRREPTERR